MSQQRVFDRKRVSVLFKDYSALTITPQVELKYLNEDGQTYTTWPVKIQKRIDENFTNEDNFYFKRCINEAIEELKKSIESWNDEEPTKNG